MPGTDCFDKTLIRYESPVMPPDWISISYVGSVWKKIRDLSGEEALGGGGCNWFLLGWVGSAFMYKFRAFPLALI